jgi:argininosuccinate lyase
MIAMADDETFAKERIVAFTWNIFQTDLAKKAAHVEDLKFEEFIKKVTYASAVKLLKKAQRD